MAIYEERWPGVAVALRTADAIAFDGCHKIYVLMDTAQTQQQEDWGYGADNAEYLSKVRDLTTAANILSREDALKRLHEWFDQSCPLKFITQVRTVPKHVNPNEGYVHLISQFDGDDEDEDPETFNEDGF